MKKRHFIIIGSVIGILGLSALGMKTMIDMKEPPPEAEKQEIKRYVEAEEVSYQTVSSEISASGRLASQSDVSVITEVQGKILQGSVALKKGQSFRRGQVLLRVFDNEAELALQAHKSRFMNAVANLLPDFRIDFPDSYDTWLAFFEKIKIDESLPELPAIQNNQEKIYLASRNILSEYFTIQSEEIRLEKYTIRAPFSGTFTEVLLEVGAVANPGSRVATIIRTDRLELEVPVPDKDIEWIQVGDKVQITNRRHTQNWEGKVVRKAGFIDATTQSMSIFVAVQPRSDAPLYTGQYLEASFSGIPVENVMEIPRAAVFNSNEVYIVANGYLKKQQISIHKYNEKTLLFSGLPEGTQLVVEPLVNAKEEMKVEVIQ